MRFAKVLNRGRARIEQMMGEQKRFKRVALRCEKTDRNFRSIVALAATFVLIKSVDTAWGQSMPAGPEISVTGFISIAAKLNFLSSRRLAVNSTFEAQTAAEPLRRGPDSWSLKLEPNQG